MTWTCPSCSAAGVVDAVPHQPWCPLFMRELERAVGDEQTTIEQEEVTTVMTYRERREARAARRRQWANSREQKAAGALETSQRALDGIEFGQPVLLGHHSQRRHQGAITRSDNATRRYIEHADMQKHHEQAASTIEAQLRTSIYSDDVDAIERLEEKIARLEAERDRVKAYNATARKGAPNLELVDERQRVDLLGIARVQAYAMSKGGGFPSYHLSNLSANINRLRKRLEALRKEA